MDIISADKENKLKLQAKLAFQLLDRNRDFLLNFQDFTKTLNTVGVKHDPTDIYKMFKKRKNQVIDSKGFQRLILEQPLHQLDIEEALNIIDPDRQDKITPKRLSDLFMKLGLKLTPEDIQEWLQENQLGILKESYDRSSVKSQLLNLNQ